MSTALLGTMGGLVMVETVEPNDPHPKGATREDGTKLALVNCQCRFCLDKHMSREIAKLEGKVWSDGLL